MKVHSLVIAAAAAVAAYGAHAQIAVITQSGSADSATIDQTAAPGGFSSAFINQAGGSGNDATIIQSPSTPGSTSANVNQFGTTGNIGRVFQLGTSNGTTLDLNQQGGSGTTADLLQVNVASSRIRADQFGANTSFMRVQQTEGSTGAFAGAEQIGSGLQLTLIQGQPAFAGGGIINSSGRIFQNGQDNTAVSVQSGVSNSVSYLSQGSLQEPGWYWGGAISQWVAVEPGLVPEFTANSDASISQNGGFGHRGYILQYGTGQSAHVSQSGSGNLGGILQTGSGHVASVTQTGFGGTATVSQHGAGQSAFINQGGVGNNAAIRQR